MAKQSLFRLGSHDRHVGALGHLHGRVHEAVLGDAGVRVDQEDDLAAAKFSELSMICCLITNTWLVQARHSHADVALGPGLAVGFLQGASKSGVVQVSLVELGPVLGTLACCDLGAHAHLIHDILDTEREGIAVIEVAGLFEPTPPFKAIHAVRGSSDVPDVMVSVELDPPGSVFLVEELEAVVAYDDVDGTALPLKDGRGALHTLKSRHDDVLEGFLVHRELDRDGQERE